MSSFINQLRQTVFCSTYLVVFLLLELIPNASPPPPLEGGKKDKNVGIKET